MYRAKYHDAATVLSSSTIHTRLAHAALACAAAAGLLGCPGRIEHPEDFLTPRCAITVDVEQDILANRCGFSGCHAATNPSAGLDLVSPGLAGRLVNVPARTCPDQLRVVRENVSAGYLIAKLHVGPPCGDRMPVGGTPLTSQEIECVAAWSATLDPDASVDASRDANSDAGTDGGLDTGL